MLIRKTALAAALWLGFAGVPAAASIISVDIRGFVSDGGEDPTGVFGSESNIAGQDFLADFLFDTSLGTRTTTASSDKLTGYTPYPTGNPLVSSSITIEGRTYTFNGSQSSEVFENGSALQASNFDDGKFNGADLSLLTFYLPTPGLPDRIGQSYKANVSATDGHQSGFQVFREDSVGNIVAFAQGDLTATSVDVHSVSPAPEPATWLLMILGVGLTGAMLRRGRHQGAVALPV